MIGAQRIWVATAGLYGVMMFFGVSGSAAEPEPIWKAGVARVIITPAEAMWMAGYGNRDHPAEGTLHDLWAKALILEDSRGERAVLVTTDLLGLPKDISERVCARLGQQLGLERRQIMLTSSHTHCGPVLRDALYDIYPIDEEQRSKIERYSQHLEDRLVQLVGEAAGQLQPVQLSAGMGVTRFAVNRRNNPEASVLQAAQLAGPMDHSVPVLGVRRKDGSLLAVAFGYACHNTVLSFYQWCGDYAGFAQRELETAHPEATALFFAGCGADQNPLPRRSVALAEQYGRELAAAVDTALAGTMTALEPALHTVFTTIDLALDQPPAREELQRLTQNDAAYIQRWAKRQLARLERGEALVSEYPYPVQVWQLGQQTVVALGGEVVVDYSLRLKRELGPELWVVGYANDVMAYIPSLRVLREGGYEGASSMYVYGLPTTWTADIEERIVGQTHRLVAQVRDEPVPLSVGDGHTIPGWRKIQTGHGDGGRWISKNGELVGEQEPPGSGNGGVLIASKPYGNFELSLEINPDWGVCSGIFLRSNEQGQCYQVMVDYHTEGNVGSIYGEGTGGFTNRNYSFQEDKSIVEVKKEGIFPLPFAPEDFAKHYKVDDWNEVRAHIVGNPPKIEVWLNGTKISQFQDDQKRLPDRGYMGIQVHGGKSWPVGKKTRFRKLRIRELR